jgi:hypothetical protein
VIRTLCLLALALCAAASFAAPLEIATRGQAQLVARRHAIDEAVANLQEQVMALEVQSGVTLAQWVEARPDAMTDVTRALRGADLTLDDPSQGRWRVEMELTVEDLNTALESRLRRGLTADPERRLRAEGSAAIAWEGADVNVPVPTSSSPPPEEVAEAPAPAPAEPNLPPLGTPIAAPSAYPPAATRTIVVNPNMLDWDDQFALSATGEGRTVADATAAARRELEAQVRALPVASSATVGDWADALASQEAALDLILSLATETDRRLTAAGVCEVDLAVPLTGLRLTLLNEEMQP